MPGVRPLRLAGAIRYSLLALCVFAAFAIAPSIAGACTPGPYTECVPSAPGGGGGGGHGGGHATASSEPGGGGGSGQSAGGGKGASGGATVATEGSGSKKRAHSQGKKGKSAGTIPAGTSTTPPSSGSGGGVPTIAWILIALAVIALIAGSILVMRNRRGEPGLPAREPPPRPGPDASPDAP